MVQNMVGKPPKSMEYTQVKVNVFYFFVTLQQELGMDFTSWNFDRIDFELR